MAGEIDGSEQVLWSKRIAASNSLYVAARRYCRRFEDLEETMDREMWETLTLAISGVRAAAEEASREVG